MKRKTQFAKEQKCPKCGSLQVGRAGSSTKFLSGEERIRLECYKCGENFYVSKYKP